MSLIIPQTNKSVKENIPSWVKTSELITASKEELERNKGFQKTASQQNLPTVIAQYVCPNCQRVVHASAPELKTQEDLAKRASKEFKPTCEVCKTELVPYRKVGASVVPTQRQGDMTQKEVDISVKSGTYNTFVDRHLVFKAIDALRNYASQQGMQLAEVRYLKSEHSKQAGQEYPMVNNIECEVRWKTSPKVAHTVTATIVIDQAGMAKMPTMMTLADRQTVVPFTKESVKEIEEKFAFDHEVERKQKRTDMATYKRPDISRFRAIASQEQTDTSSLIDELVESSKKKVESLVKEADNIPGVQAPVMPSAPVQYSPNQQIVNPLDGKTYTVKQHAATGITVTDPQTQQESIIPADQIANVRPAVKTSSFSVQSLAEELLNEKVSSTYGDFLAHYGREVEDALRKIRKGLNNISEQQWNDIEQKLNIYDKEVKSSILHWLNMGYIPDLQEVADLAVRNQNYNGTETKQVSNALNDIALTFHLEDKNENIEIEGNLKKKASFKPSTRPLMEHVPHMSQDWANIRKGLKTKSQLNKESADISYDSSGPKKDKTGHDASGVPFSEESKIEVGMTEFPKDQDRSKGEGKGYEISFKKMDENQVEEREQFDNKQRLHIPSLPWKELREMVGGKEPKENLGLSATEASALEKVIGITKTAEGEDEPKASEEKEGKEPVELPITHKPLKTAPKIKEYEEPAVIQPAEGKLKEAITKWRGVQNEIATIKDQMQKKIAPLQQAVSEASAPFQEQQGKLTKELSTYLNLVFSKLGETEDKVAAYEDTILARLERQIETGGKISLDELLSELQKNLPEIHAKVAELKQQMEEAKIQPAIERFLYEYPKSKVQEKKVKSSTDSFSLDTLISTLVGWADILNDILELIPTLE